MCGNWCLLICILLSQKEREAYEVIVECGKLVYRQSGNLVSTAEGSKWIFVLSASRNLYVGEKKKGLFQHSSFVSGGATIASGRLVACNGVLEVCLLFETWRLHFLRCIFIPLSIEPLIFMVFRLYGATAAIIARHKRVFWSSLAS